MDMNEAIGGWILGLWGLGFELRRERDGYGNGGQIRGENEGRDWEWSLEYRLPWMRIQTYIELIKHKSRFVVSDSVIPLL